ncbi:MAG: ROK family protein [Planctomycetota bacterium]|jgi:glucokinase
MGKDLVVGVDLGATNIRAGLVSLSGEVSRRRQAATPAAQGTEAVADAIAAAVRACVSAGGGGGPVRGVGLGSPGTIDLENGVVLFSPNMPGWRDVPLRSMVERRLELPVALENDANAAALGEQWVGAGRGAPSLVLLTLGTGIGGGIVLGGRIWHGAGGVAGEIGHMCIDPQGPRCGCGSRGCLETYASATAMVARMQRAIRDGVRTSLRDAADELTAARIHRAAVAGDAAARENIEMSGRYLGVGVSNIMHVLNPQVVALSGGVTAAGQMLLEPLLDEVGRRTLAAASEGARICFAELPEDAGLIGAARAFVLARG